MPFQIVRNDITKMRVDAIVNAANTDLQPGGGVCGAIFQAAGAARLQEACSLAAPIKTGEAAITPGFALYAKYIIHAAGPIYSHWSAEQNEIYLRSAYTKALVLARKNHCKSIAFPLISSGIYGYPKDKALAVATSAIRDFLLQCDMDIYLVVFDTEAFQSSTDVAGSVASYIDEYYVQTHEIKRSQFYERRADASQTKAFLPFPAAASMPANADVAGFLDKLDEPMSETLLRLIDKKGKTDVEVYKRANIDRKLFSKIRTGKGYLPGKRTILALAIALELSLEETNDLLRRGGYALSHSQKFDVIIEYFIVNRKYDIFAINEVLFQYDQPLLGG